MQQTGIPSAGAVREVFEQVLAEPDFRSATTSPLLRAFRAVVDWIQDLVNRWFPALGEGEVRILSWVFMGASAIFAGHLLWRRFGGRGRPREPRADSTTTPSEEPRDASEWMEWARGAAEQGRLRDAATGVYQATVLTLDARGALRYREWKTPGDYANEVAGQDVRAPFLDFLGRFVEMAFGSAEPTPEAFETFAAGAARLRGAA